MGISFDYNNAFVSDEDISKIEEKVLQSYDRLEKKESPFTGWLDYSHSISAELINEITNMASQVKEKCNALILIGIGGSYLGPKTCVEMLSSTFSHEEKNDYPQLYFAGNNLSGLYHKELLDLLENKEVCLCFVSKSGNTMEPNIAFSILKEFMIKKYGPSYKDRIYVVTENNEGALRKETNLEGYKNLVFPKDIGGRYSVLSPGGLLPIAMSGIDIKEILRGAHDAYHTYNDRSIDNICCKYAAIRNILFTKGKSIEIFESFEPRLQSFSDWLMQLFGESEGKDRTGLFPSGLNLTTDMHSIGQFLQDGNPIFFETVIHVLSKDYDLAIPKTPYFDFHTKSLNTINDIAVEGISNAHSADLIPNLRINIPELSPYYFGYLVYFFMKVCAISGYILGVDPFTQYGVEKYKNSVANLMKQTK